MAAANNSIEAAVRAATIYDQAKMYAEALPYYQKAASKGDAVSEYKCGDYLYNGKGIKVNKAQAAAYLDKAAKRMCLMR